MPVPEVWDVVPTSCADGADWAWERQRANGVWEMIGCTCHHNPPRMFVPAWVVRKERIAAGHRDAIDEKDRVIDGLVEALLAKGRVTSALASFRAVLDRVPDTVRAALKGGDREDIPSE